MNELLRILEEKDREFDKAILGRDIEKAKKINNVRYLVLDRLYLKSIEQKGALESKRGLMNPRNYWEQSVSVSQDIEIYKSLMDNFEEIGELLAWNDIDHILTTIEGGKSNDKNYKEEK